MKKDKTYPGGARQVLDHYESRRDPFVFAKELLPPLDVDLVPLKYRLVTEEATEQAPPRSGSFAVKKRWIAREFVGNSELAYLNAQLIANLRRRSRPEHCSELFQRIWQEESEHLINALDMRWKVSSVTSFADCGLTSVQRELGRGLHVLFGMMKLYEFERTFSRMSPEDPWSSARRKRAKLALDMDPYSLSSGGLDTAILAPLWELARYEPVMGPLACHLLDALNADDRNIFHRLELMRQEQKELAKSALDQAAEAPAEPDPAPTTPAPENSTESDNDPDKTKLGTGVDNQSK